MKIKIDDPGLLWTTDNNLLGAAIRVASAGGDDAGEKEVQRAFLSRHLWENKKAEVMAIAAKIKRVE